MQFADNKGKFEKISRSVRARQLRTTPKGSMYKPDRLRWHKIHEKTPSRRLEPCSLIPTCEAHLGLKILLLSDIVRLLLVGVVSHVLDTRRGCWRR